jgi:two-component system, sensor histidine kinase
MDASGTAAKSILIVEDTPINALLLRSYLKRLGLNADLVVNGQEAINYVTTGNKPDIIFMDCQMPVMDGYEATTRIRAYERERGADQPIPIVALTASAFEDDRIRCMQSGMDDFITKPFNFETLMAVMQKYSPQSSKAA